MSEGLWHLTRTLPENHAIMVSLGEGLMPKAGETPEMGANPLLGFGRVYARPEVAQIVDRRVRRLLNEPGHTFEQFHGWLQARGITMWGAAVDTLENTSRFAEGKATGPMTVLPPVRLAAEDVAPVRVVHGLPDGAAARDRGGRAALGAARLPDAARARARGDRGGLSRAIRRENIHVWTLRGKSREARLGNALGGVEGARRRTSSRTAGRRPSGIEVFTDSGTYAPTFLVGSWKDDAGETHVFLCDGYAATAEAMQAASLVGGARRRRLDGDVLARASSCRATPRDSSCSSTPTAPDFAQRVRGAVRRARGRRGRSSSTRRRSARPRPPTCRSAGRVAARRRLPAREELAGAGVASATSATTRTPGRAGVTRVADGVYRVTTRLATRQASSRITFTFRLMEPLEKARHVFSPLLVRFMSGVDHTTRPVKISDSGRIRNELQTMLSQALEHDGEHDPRPLRPDRREGDAAREAGGDPRGARVVQARTTPCGSSWLEIA